MTTPHERDVDGVPVVLVGFIQVHWIETKGIGLTDKGLIHRPEADIEQRNDITACIISTWVEMSNPPNGYRLHVEVEFTYEGMEFTGQNLTSESGVTAFRPLAMKLKNPRVLRAEIIGQEMGNR